jgi:hypothetical protein
MSGPGERNKPAGADSLVLLTVLILLIAGALLAWLSSAADGSPNLFAKSDQIATWAATFLIGGMVGAAELLSRYRDNPRDAAGSAPGIVYMVCNGLAAVLALFLLRQFEFPGFKPPTDSLASQALIAGTGAMVIIRSKLFTIRQPNGSDVAFGPAFVLDTFLSTINREVDRRRMPLRNRKVADWAARLRPHPFRRAAPFLNAALAAFQDMDEDDAQRLRDEYTALESDPKFAAYDDEVKYYLVGFDILTVFGEPAFESLFESLEKYLNNVVAAAQAAADSAQHGTPPR